MSTNSMLEKASGNAHTQFMRVANGKIVRKVSEPTNDSKVRINQQGAEVHEEFYESVKGQLVGLDIVDGQYGKNLFMKLASTENSLEESITISFGVFDRYGSSLMYKLPNLSMGDVIKMVPYDFVDKDDRRVIGVTIYKKAEEGNSFSDKIPPFYSKDSEIQVPFGEKREVVRQGEKVEEWDFSERDLFLMEQLSAWQFKQPDYVPPVNDSPTSVEVEDFPSTKDDMPF